MKNIYITIIFVLFVSSTSFSAEKNKCDGKALINKFFCKTWNKTGFKKPKIPKLSLKKDPLVEVKEKKTIADFFKKKNEPRRKY